MKSGVKVTKDRTKEVMRGVESLSRKDVLVGIPSSTSNRPEEMDAAITNAQLGYLHETGAPASNIPARPFLLPGVRESTKRFTPFLKKAAQAGVDGKIEGVDRELHKAGQVAASGVQRKLTQGPFVPLKASTLRRRRSRGRTGTRPLIDTGQLRRSITYVIRGDK